MALSRLRTHTAARTSSTTQFRLYKPHSRPKCFPVASVSATAMATPTTSVPTAPHQSAASRSYVNLEATADDFHRVLARLALGAPGAPPGSCATTHSYLTLASELDNAPAAPPPKSKPWAGLLGGLLGGHHSDNNLGSQCGDVSVDDGSPLRRCVVMFTATWCGPCSLTYKQLQHASGLLTSGLRQPAAILVIDVDKNAELASEMGVKALPTLLYLGSAGSKPPIFTQGPVSSSFILDMLDRAEGFGGRDLKAKWMKL